MISTVETTSELDFDIDVEEEMQFAATNPTKEVTSVWVVEHIPIDHDELPYTTMHEKWEDVKQRCDDVIRKSRIDEYGFKRLMTVEQREKIEDEVLLFMQDILVEGGERNNTIIVNDVQASENGFAHLRVLRFDVPSPGHA